MHNAFAHRYKPLAVRIGLNIRQGEPDECWPWLAAKFKSGYGQIMDKGKALRAHRVVCELSHGAGPEGSVVLHSCDNPACCNPAHLRWGTQSENIQEMYDKGRRYAKR